MIVGCRTFDHINATRRKVEDGIFGVAKAADALEGSAGLGTPVAAA